MPDVRTGRWCGPFFACTALASAVIVGSNAFSEPQGVLVNNGNTFGIRKLLDIASDSLEDLALADSLSLKLPVACAELNTLLAQRNGFYAFESALHVLPLGGVKGTVDCVEWNTPSRWRNGYGDVLSPETFFFAEDVFGSQFGLATAGVFKFEPETGTSTPFANDLEDWAKTILEDFRVATGWPLAHEWQVVHGPIPRGQRLVPVIPFILGGEYVVENLHSLDATTGMRLRADFFDQMRDVPDGAKVKIIIGKRPGRKRFWRRG